MSTLKVNAIRSITSSRDNISLNADGTIDKPILLTNLSTTLGGVGSLTTTVANTGILQATAQINKGTTGWTTSGANAYTFVCPVTGVYGVNAHISYANINPAREIWVMAYTA